MFVKYLRKTMSADEIIQKLAVILGKLEVKAIGRLVEEMELPKILEKYLSSKEQSIYYKSRYKLKELLNR